MLFDELEVLEYYISMYKDKLVQIVLKYIKVFCVKLLKKILDFL